MNKDVILGIVRHLLTAGGGALASNGFISADDVTSAVGAVMTVIGLVLSVYDKVKK